MPGNEIETGEGTETDVYPHAPHESQVLVLALCGSRAYRTSTAGSDFDWHGVFAAAPGELDGVYPLDDADQTWVQHGELEDFSLHEAGKFCRLAAKCNPSAIETLWAAAADSDSVCGAAVATTAAVTPLGRDLVEIRTTFLSAPRVRDAYLGFMRKQLRLLSDRHADPADERRAKHAKHIKRLAECGAQLWRTGDMAITVADPAAYHDFGEYCREERSNRTVAALVDEHRAVFDEPTPLPDRPDMRPAADWLARVRTAYSSASWTGVIQ